MYGQANSLNDASVKAVRRQQSVYNAQRLPLFKPSASGFLSDGYSIDVHGVPKSETEVAALEYKGDLPGCKGDSIMATRYRDRAQRLPIKLNNGLSCQTYRYRSKPTSMRRG